MKARAVVVLVLTLLCSCGRNPLVLVEPQPRLSVTFFDVGQGDAALLRTSEGANVVIDTGHNGEIVPLLRSEGVTRIDLLILSHPHEDHIGGLNAILRTFSVRETWYAGEYRGRFRRMLDSVGRSEAVFTGKTKTLGRLSLVVLHPETGSRYARGTESEVNNGSLVVKAVYGVGTYLFPGDCELGCWEEMFKLHRADLSSDVLKAAHHGSWNGTNSGVLGAVRPGTVVISCGRGNRYGHPHQIVLTLIQRLRAKMFRTDEQGTIHCVGTDCRSGE